MTGWLIPPLARHGDEEIWELAALTVPNLLHHCTEMLETPDRPGSDVRMSAFGLICAGMMPKSLSSWGVATYNEPDQGRPLPSWLRLALSSAPLPSSGITSWAPI